MERSNSINVSQALNSFWNSFGLLAYDELTVPNGEHMPSFPYITFNTLQGDSEETLQLVGSIFYNSTSWEEVTEKAEEISDRLKNGGQLIKVNNGHIWIKKANPFMQRVAEEDENLRRIYLQIEVTYHIE